MAYTLIGCGPDTIHFVCIKAMSPVSTTFLMSYSKRVFIAASGANCCLSASLPFVISPA